MHDADWEAMRRWDSLARLGKWVVAVYRSQDATKVDVVRIKRTHVNDHAMLRIQADVARVFREQDVEHTKVDERSMLDVPVDRILWYEVIGDLAQDDVTTFNAAVAKGMDASRQINYGEPLAAAVAGRRKPR
ncbi:MAG: hypothetical protein DCC67_02370 [Planctomycetota bacterium]|nr:MAG: hypothetical protein DCC67_02370 [Planctomycetota bacterium]